MDNSNIKVYLAISGALIVLFILIILIPFSSKKTTTQDKITNPNSQLFPTSVDSNPLKVANQVTPVTIPADFTGALEEKIPQQIIDLAAQKKDLRLKVPLSLSSFTIDFDYSEDKFTLTLNDPKDQSQKEFESWKLANYPLLGSDQFLLK